MEDNDGSSGTNKIRNYLRQNLSLITILFILFVIGFLGLYITLAPIVDGNSWWRKPLDALNEHYFFINKKYFNDNYLALLSLLVAFLSIIIAGITTFITYLFSKRVFDITKLANNTADNAYKLALKDHKFQFNKEIFSNYYSDREAVRLSLKSLNTVQDDITINLETLENEIKKLDKKISSESKRNTQIIIKLKIFIDNMGQLENTYNNLRNNSHFISSLFYDFIRKIEDLQLSVKNEDDYNLININNFNSIEFIQNFEQILMNSEIENERSLPRLLVEGYYRPNFDRYADHLLIMDEVFNKAKELLIHYDESLERRYRKTVNEVINTLQNDENP
ncbi:hypothetical protein [Peribacillus simplex]|uniref:Uncharacterized protein n=1 Tax=Peribacillus simplex TaxID=1478 RepID=A0AAN2PES3_9BACI|nr:hypothetical protein [Peribacillus simplex]CEG31054.1 hypothetical protein BN1180_01190 [Peribacillus simplex]